MFISKKKYNALIDRINCLEKRESHVENLLTANTYEFGTVNLKSLCRQLPGFIDKRIDKKIAADKSKLSTAEKD